MRKAVLAIALALVASAEVLKLDNSNFDQYVNGKKSVMVKFFAPWCGHCKRLAPDYETLSDNFKTSKKVVIAEVDCDSEKDLCGRFEVRGYPTIKFFPFGSVTPVDYSGGRTVEELTKFVEENSGTKGKSARPAVVVLTADNFDKIVNDENKNVLVKYFAPWCGHCKKLAPAYEEVASIYKNDEEVVIAEIDCDAHKELCQAHGVSGYPTLKFYGQDNKEVEYQSGREVEDFMTFIKEKTSVDRQRDGSLSRSAGIVKELEEAASKFLSASVEKRDELLDKARMLDAGSYMRIMELIIEKGEEALHKEKARLEKLLGNKNIAAKKRDQFQISRNIIETFLP